MHIYPPVIKHHQMLGAVFFFLFCSLIVLNVQLYFFHQDLISLWLMSRSTMRHAKQFTLLFTFNSMSRVTFFFKRCLRQTILLLLKISFYFSLILLLQAGVIGLPSGEKLCCIKKLNDAVLLALWVTMETQQLYLFFIAYQIN